MITNKNNSTQDTNATTVDDRDIAEVLPIIEIDDYDTKFEELRIICDEIMKSDD